MVQASVMTGRIGRWLAVGTVSLSAFVPWNVSHGWAGGRPATLPASHGHLPSWQVLVAAASAPHLSHPKGLAIDRRGPGVQKWLYVADTGDNRIVKLGTGGRFLGSWGSRGTGPGQFQQPQGIAIDRQGNVYVADTGNNRIQKFGPQGRFLIQWGTHGTGPGQFDLPAAVAVGGSGNVFVADRKNGRIEKFSPSGHLLAVWPVFIPASSNPAGFGPRGPYALTVDASGNVSTAIDTGQCSGGHCVMDYIALQTLNPSGKVVRTVVGSNPYGPFSYQPVPGVTGQGPWWQIGALTADSRGHLFLAEWNPQNQSSVTKLSPPAKQIGQWELPAPSGERGWPSQGIALDPRGNVYVSDTLANRVLKLIFQP
ncbi:MAG TPA: NHL repeat-containing protein [Chloroflexota bacterium]